MAEIRGWRAVLCFPQVATKTQITAEQYLRMTFEPDAEFVRGEIVERAMPDYLHGRLEYLISLAFGRLIQSSRLYPCLEVRMKLAADVYRIPDVAVFTESQQPVPDTPPLIAIEILSKDDRHSDVMQKLEEYLAWGIANIWVVDPITKRFSAYTHLGLQNVSSFSLSNYSFQLTPSDLFSDL
jgi:Uma2 family endonuclease